MLGEGEIVAGGPLSDEGGCCVRLRVNVSAFVPKLVAVTDTVIDPPRLTEVAEVVIAVTATSCCSGTGAASEKLASFVPQLAARLVLLLAYSLAAQNVPSVGSTLIPL